MAKLRTPLLPNQVARFRGILDYYVQRGVPIVRSWPKKPRRIQSSGERLAQCHMNYALEVYRCSPRWWTDQMQLRLEGFTWNRRDYFMSHYLSPIGYNELPGQGHHPPQPLPCPGGNGHYFALMDTYAIESGRFTKKIYWVFDQPLKYELWILPRHPSTFTIFRRRQGITHAITPIPPLEPPDIDFFTLTNVSPNTYSANFLQLPVPFGEGTYWAYIRGYHPQGGHPAISLTPWFQFTIPHRESFTSPRAASGITLINVATDEVFDPEESTREPRDLLDYKRCLFATV